MTVIVETETILSVELQVASGLSALDVSGGVQRN